MRFVLTSEMQLCCCPHSFDLPYLKTSLLVDIKGKEEKGRVISSRYVNIIRTSKSILLN